VFETREGGQQVMEPAMHGTRPSILSSNEPAARMWSAGGSAYNDISFGICDALAHAAQRLNAKHGQTILDVATGTGWTARNVAATGAEVTGVDIASDLLAAAEVLSAHVRPPIVYRLADAERLPFPDAAFDGVISTFGVMFAADQKQAAAELARVCKPGGRLSLATWVPDGSVAEFFGIVGKHAKAPPPEAPPLAWGDLDHVRRLLGDAFALTFERGTNHAYYDSPTEIREWFERGFGPVRQLLANLDPAGQEAFRADIDAYHEHYKVDAGLHVRRDYLVVIGRRL
jgi:SAM-dependent methyltransferase